MNTRNLRTLLIVALALAPTAAFTEPVGLDPGSPAYKVLTPLAVNDKENPLHLTASQQYHINARKTRFQTEANAIFKNPKISNVNKGNEVKALEKDAIRDILAMLDDNQRARVQAAQHAAMAQNQNEAGQSRARQDLYARYVALGDGLLKTIAPQQRAALMQLEKTSRASAQAIMSDKTLSKDQKSAKLHSLFTSYVRQRDAIYTPAQRATIEQMAAIKQQAQSIR